MNDLLDDVEKLCKIKRLQKLFAAIKRQELSGEFANISFLERLIDALNHQVDCDRDARIAKLRRDAKLRWPTASIHDFVGEDTQQLNPEVLQNFANCKWIEAHRHIAITGPSGAGKTRLACALSNEAMSNGISVMYCQFQRLVRHLEAKEKLGAEEYDKLVKKLMKYKVLFIDDWGLMPLNLTQSHLLFDIIERREHSASLILTSQYPTEKWGEAFNNEKLVASVLDRIGSYSSRITLDIGEDEESWRWKKSQSGDGAVG